MIQHRSITWNSQHNAAPHLAALFFGNLDGFPPATASTCSSRRTAIPAERGATRRRTTPSNGRGTIWRPASRTFQSIFSQPDFDAAANADRFVWASGSTEYVGQYGTGTFNQTGGANAAGTVSGGDESGSNGTYNLSGTGSLSVSGSELVVTATGFACNVSLARKVAGLPEMPLPQTGKRQIFAIYYE
jgi:hypothetical protein